MKFVKCLFLFVIILFLNDLNSLDDKGVSWNSGFWW